MAKFKIEVVVPDGESCRHKNSEDPCDFVREDQCNDLVDCCLFGQNIKHDLSMKCPKCWEITSKLPVNVGEITGDIDKKEEK